ncbi:pantoate--beta-alanine ligase [Paenibacillus sp. GSMTC-2017]|uniref:pantoate--beta-alanine ligase n=1 Tax=Paenibacillus sp. GSMTC-2017 TaxID=2794350 RepID=UPI0018D6B07A|nr:pantoate--beta-alanine ligase [Paenibacillus sp. GSMTC-2017]MBH5317921.1 pantoate--beta-alanine ligase [Paenibacillus sp. GSMTC-2017]
MIVCRTKEELKSNLNQLRANEKSVGFVPTMGYLHEGHGSLLRLAHEANDISVLSIYVNPMQFGPNEDLDRYPRDEERDLKLAEECGTDIVFIPSNEEMYPKKPLTTVVVNGLTSQLCGATRPGHFDGVGLVVSKLFHLVKPDRAYFGMKDAQQVAVIEQIVDDLNFDIEIVPCQIVREPDGLALSSRNVYLNAEQRAGAVVLSQSLHLAEEWIKETGVTAGSLIERVKSHIGIAKEANIEYVELLHYPTLEPIEVNKYVGSITSRIILALAVKFGTTRLIDNSLLNTSGGANNV